MQLLARYHGALHVGAWTRSQAITSSMISGPSGSLWSSWRRPGNVRRSTPGAPSQDLGRRRPGRGRRRGRGGPGSGRRTRPPRAARTRACSASPAAPNRAVLAVAFRAVGAGLRADRRVARQRRAVDAVRDRERRRDPREDARDRLLPAGQRRIEAGRRRGPRGPAWAGRSGGSRRRSSPPIEWPYSDDRAARRRQPGPPPAARRGRRGTATSGRCRRAARPTRRCRAWS